jgi:hypothetical protein
VIDQCGRNRPRASSAGDGEDGDRDEQPAPKSLSFHRSRGRVREGALLSLPLWGRAGWRRLEVLMSDHLGSPLIVD